MCVSCDLWGQKGQMTDTLYSLIELIKLNYLT